ncbi:MAG: hypothetical protein Q8L73_02620 [Methylotenera sp.]|nr:hypothetical protein [Methylotenera sp.]
MGGFASACQPGTSANQLGAVFAAGRTEALAGGVVFTVSAGE